MNDVSRQPVSISPWPLMLIAAAILMITMGARQSMGCSCRRSMPSWSGYRRDQLRAGGGTVHLGRGAANLRASRTATARKNADARRSAARRRDGAFVSSQWALLITLGVMTAAGAGGRQLFDPDRGHRAGSTGSALQVVHQRRRQLRSVCIRAPQPGAHQCLRLGLRDGDDGGYRALTLPLARLLRNDPAAAQLPRCTEGCRATSDRIEATATHRGA